MEFRSIVFLFMVISVIVVNLFGYAAGKSQVDSTTLV